ncbi:MAG: Uma2 family endonuclease [Sphaerospermopsis sp. SIO1G2]|nr:Uma2 family endonuclease [Sphaerospermopsis sp. SIO1G1]NET69644.1 Uma2 family endonuclease [Sphaerospermopsis sp. SIO1G2]
MTLAKPTDIDITYLPDHTELPESDGTFVKNFQEHPQSILLTDSINSTLQKIHPDGQYAIGQDCGIYWRLTEPPEKGAEAPDWFYVANVPPMLKDKFRRSYVLWQEYIAPLIVLEFVSGNGTEERDKTPFKGKFWVYEQAIRVPFYGIYEEQKASIEVYHLVNGSYELLPANERDHYPILPLGVELGIWEGQYNNMQAPWLRWWDLQGNLLLHSGEKCLQLTSELEQEQEKAARLAERLRELGVNPDEV